jgi:protein-tyrosine-phosphatase
MAAAALFSAMKDVMFICTGNVCRSPMAEGFYRQQTGTGDEIRVGSAGISAFDGQLASQYSEEVMQQEGIDISDHASRMLTPEIIAEASHIFGMTRSHRDAVQMMFPAAREKVFVLREFLVGADADFDLDVSDPIGGSLEEYVRTRNLIKEALPSVTSFINETANS